MLSIGEFSNICKVSAKTLRYYDEIGLLKPGEINPESGYRYYAIEQLETILFINRMKAYSFSLDEIKAFLQSGADKSDDLHEAFLRKQKELENEMRNYGKLLSQLQTDISAIEQGRSVMSYLDAIDVTLADMPKMNLLYVREKVQAEVFPEAYRKNFGSLFKRIAVDRLTMTGAPMVLFHDAEYSPAGLDTEFAIPVAEYVKGTRDFTPGLCLKTVVRGEYSELSSVYTKQIKWAEKEGLICNGALFEVYVTDPSQIQSPADNITEVYYPVKPHNL